LAATPHNQDSIFIFVKYIKMPSYNYGDDDDNDRATTSLPKRCEKKYDPSKRWEHTFSREELISANIIDKFKLHHLALKILGVFIIALVLILAYWGKVGYYKLLLTVMMVGCGLILWGAYYSHITLHSTLLNKLTVLITFLLAVIALATALSIKGATDLGIELDDATAESIYEVVLPVFAGSSIALTLLSLKY